MQQNLSRHALHDIECRFFFSKRVTVSRALRDVRAHPAHEGQVRRIDAAYGAEDSKSYVGNRLALGGSTSA